jgi:hypothetical protein
MADTLQQQHWYMCFQWQYEVSVEYVTVHSGNMRYIRGQYEANMNYHRDMQQAALDTCMHDIGGVL